MVKVLLQDANFLMLDEPTNHLDITSKEILLQALKEYPGTILFVSHDRDFVNDLATDIIELTPECAYRYQGNYDSFVYQKEQATQRQEIKPKQVVVEHQQSAGKDNFEHTKSIKRLEHKIEKLSKTIDEHHIQIAQLGYGSLEYARLMDELKQLEKERDEQTNLWESMQRS
jgi:ATP-binding cassette subfamily F protein 3